MIEKRRLKLQADIDGGKTSAERNAMGQFATPSGLAFDMLTVAKSLLAGNTPVRFLDPAFGTGSFYSALLKVFPSNAIRKAQGYEIDPLYGEPAQDLWAKTGLELKLSDFTKASPPEDEDGKFNLVICNPPYVRHHHIDSDDKLRLGRMIAKRHGIKFSGLAGLYCYFLAISVGWMAKDGIAGWLIPSEFMDVNYGSELKRFLLEKVTLLHIHRFDPTKVQFGDALVSSAVVWFKNTPPPKNHSVEFTFDGNLAKPSLTKLVSRKTLEKEAKWTRFPVSEAREASGGAVLADFFKIKRGLATGVNRFFILTEETVKKMRLPKQFLKPILPSPRYLKTTEVFADEDGVPKLDKRLFLLDCPLPEEEVKSRYPSLWEYLKQGKKERADKGYLCANRSPWYMQESRPPSPFVFTYIGRSDNGNKPFRFILNRSEATVTNSYLILYPKPHVLNAITKDGSLVKRIWKVLSEISTASMLEEGRVYGGGLHKMEPKELAKVPAVELAKLLTNTVRAPKPVPKGLAESLAKAS